MRIAMPDAIDYLNPDLPANLARVTMRVIDATAGHARRLRFSRRRSRELQDRDRALAGAGHAAGRRRHRRPGRHDRRHVHQRMERRHPLRAQCGRRRPLHPRVWRRARARRSRPRARSAAHPAVACELPSGRRTALLPARREAVPGAARAAGRRHRSPRNSCASASTAARASTFIRTSGTKACSPRPARSDSSTSRALCTRACPSTSRASSDACSKRRSDSARRRTACTASPTDF